MWPFKSEVNEIMVKVKSTYRTETYTVRCWMPWPEAPTVVDIKTQRRRLEAFVFCIDLGSWPPGLAAKELCSLMRANAVEVLDHDGNGALHYPSWP